MDPCGFTITEGIQSFSCQINCHLERNLADKDLYSNVEIVGIHQRKSQARGKEKYILVLPRKTACSSCGRKSCYSVNHLEDILESWSDFDGATCAGHSVNSINNTIESCGFLTKHWSMVINEGGQIQTRQMATQNISFFKCNIVEAPFLIRRNVFDKLGFRPSHGEATLVDFFLRSKGTLKFATSLNCTFIDEQLVADRGAMETKEIYLDYGLLGYHHNILRVIRKDSITWTMCTRREYYCPNKPQKEIENPISRQLSLFCCDVALNQYLIDGVNGLNEVGIDYRLCRGTLLGAVRSKNIIPWTRDVDIDLTPTDYTDSLGFYRLQKVMQKKRYATPLIYQLRRIMPLFPLKTHIPNLLNNDLFSQKVLDQMRGFIPISKPEWNSIGYVDMYAYEGGRTVPTNITINGLNYKTHSNPEQYLAKTFGSSWRQAHLSGRSHEPHKPWIWRLDTSRVQEDIPTLESYCIIYQNCSMGFLSIVSFLFIALIFLPILMRIVKNILSQLP
ncbi:uncharacterized protein LOC114536739 [Dendronephthya gigantea]|uniref:uncharacterized protein LOC114536739 n=1 Tax=Dendronephthya gigantea TaxID=151771 RepID=UPI001069C414|nr:uncharacterized protein LOC114536739 [Dendronephthya gigantea]